MEKNTTTTEIAPFDGSCQIQPFASKDNFELAWKMSNALCKSSLVPPEYQGEKGVANCLIALEMAGRIGVSPFMCMQNLYVIQGRPSWSSKFLIAMINACGRFDSLQYRINDEKTSCVAYARDRRTGEVLEGPEITLQMAEDEGWSKKSGTKWKTMPELMLRYRAAAFFARVFCPELSLGLHTMEEAQDIDDVPVRRVEGYIDDSEKAKALTNELLNAEKVEQTATDTRFKDDTGEEKEPFAAPPSQPDLLHALSLLEWTPKEQADFVAKHAGGKQIGDLSEEEAQQLIVLVHNELDKKGA